MTISNIVEKIKETPIVIYKGEEKRTNLGDPDETLVKKAFEKICESWNKSENSRKFIKHIISAFYPTKDSQKVAVFKEEDVKNDKNRCCILGVKMAGVEQIGQEWAKLGLENLFVKIKDKKILTKRNNLSVEVRNATFAYSSKKSNKYLSGEATYALGLFVKMCLEYGECDVVEMFLPKEKMEKKTKKVKETTSNVGSLLGSLVDEDTMMKLRSIKGN